jgi:hypothetical protein
MKQVLAAPTGAEAAPNPPDNSVSPRAPEPEPGKCAATVKATGAPCPLAPIPNSTFCYQHDPKIVEERHLARQRGGAMTRQRCNFPVDMSTKEGVHRLLQDVAHAVTRGLLAPSAATAIASLVNSSLRLAELELEARLLEIERQVQQEIEKAQKRPGLSS